MLLLYLRFESLRQWLETFGAFDKGAAFDQFIRSYTEFGVNHRTVCGVSGVSYREWAPGAARMWLTGDFCDWDRQRYECVRNQYGTFDLFIPDNPDGSCVIPHNSIVKTIMETAGGSRIERVPCWSRYCLQNRETHLFDGVFWNPPKEKEYQWKHERPAKPAKLRIYEAHVGMSGEHPGISTYRAFAEHVLPHIKETGYNCVQLMGILEHSYYASFGYQVTNFFAVSSRCGDPLDFAYLVDTAHGLGITVIIDIIQGHASKNTLDGLNEFDGTEAHYFRAGPAGTHAQWDCRLFNLSNYETIRFLLSNLTFYLEEYRVDGFRFDAVTSMLYHHHGIGASFGDYGSYFGEACDMSAVVYLMLANYVCQYVLPAAVTIAEDVSGFPTLCRPLDQGGMGFTSRLAMAIPDKWIELIKNVPDEHWNMGNIVYTLCNRRWQEAVIAYAESHDQALVGDKTIAFRLMDAEMYSGMSVLQERTAVIDRGLQLHKMIRMITSALGGEGYLNFMGNEFGHPEWIDFPREGNGESYHYARRQWSLAVDGLLYYRQLLAFDRALQLAEESHGWLQAEPAHVSRSHEEEKVIVAERNSLLWCFNFHPTRSYPDYRVGVDQPGCYRLLLATDTPEFAGHNRVDQSVRYLTFPESCDGRQCTLQIYLPSRSGLCFCLAEEETTSL
jgi:1,4-alpha-glucan branching enzyme